MSSRTIERRAVFGFLGRLGLVGALAPMPLRRATGQTRRQSTLLIGLDISSVKFFDPARATEYASYPTLRAVYEALVTMPPGDYSQFTPLLAQTWQRTADGKGLRFHLRSGVKFASGNPVTSDDVKFSYERVANLKDQPSDQFTLNIERIDVIDPLTVDIIFKDPGIPMLGFIGAPQLAIQDAKDVVAHGGTSAIDAESTDKATGWLNQNSAGTGPYRLVRWERNTTIAMVRNPNYWRGPVPFERVIIQHMPESSVQMLALRRGDLDLAFNLTPEQITAISGDPNVRIVRKPSLDFMYMTLTSSAQINPALARKEARQAIACAIDYDGIRDSLLGGAAIRPLNFIPVGMAGSSEEQTRQFGYHQDLARARSLLESAGLPNGFSFDLAYGNEAFASVTYGVVAQKLQSDLARVGIKVNLQPMDSVNFRTMYVNGKSTSVLTFWSGNMDVSLWTLATVERVAKRVHWDVPPSTTSLCHQALREEDIPKQQALWLEFQKVLTEQCNYIVLFQPMLQVAARTSVKDVDLTAIGGLIEMYDVKPSV